MGIELFFMLKRSMTVQMDIVCDIIILEIL